MGKPNKYNCTDGGVHGEGFRTCEGYFQGAPCHRDVAMVVHSNKRREVEGEKVYTVMDESFFCTLCFEDKWGKKDSDTHGFTAIEYKKYLEMNEKAARTRQ